MKARGFRLEILVITTRPFARAWLPALSGQFTGETDEQASTFATDAAAEGMGRALLTGIPTAWRIVDTHADAVVLIATGGGIVPRLAACRYCHRTDCDECRSPARMWFFKTGIRIAPLLRPRGAGVYTTKGYAWHLTRYV